jgi:hypothetical protein
MTRPAAVPISILLAVTLGAGCHRSVTPQVEERSPGLAVVTDDVRSMREFFNAAPGGPRIIVFLTAGCASCVPAAEGLQSLFDRMKEPALRAFVVWEPVAGSGLPEDPPSAATLALIHDPRVRQVWDPSHFFSKAIADAERKHRVGIAHAHLRTEKRDEGVLFDAVALLAPGGPWDETLPPATYIGGGVSAVLPEVERRLGSLSAPQSAR